MKSEKNEEGFLTQFYTGIYIDLAWKTLKIAAMAAGIYFGGIWYLLEIPVLLGLLPYILPPEIYDWYTRVMEAIQRKLAELCVTATLYIFVNKKSKDELKNMAATWNTTIKQANDTLKNKKKFLSDCHPLPLSSLGTNGKRIIQNCHRLKSSLLSSTTLNNLYPLYLTILISMPCLCQIAKNQSKKHL